MKISIETSKKIGKILFGIGLLSLAIGVYIVKSGLIHNIVGLICISCFSSGVLFFWSGLMEEQVQSMKRLRGS